MSIFTRPLQFENELKLVVMDDGVGIPEEVDWKNSKSLGLKLVRPLVENQLDGTIDMVSLLLDNETSPIT